VRRVGIIGGGQLGQMLGFAGATLGVECLFQDPAAEPPARMAGEVLSAPFDCRETLSLLAGRCEVVTYEFENVPVAALEALSASVPIRPPPEALRRAQDRLEEKKLFEALGIPVVPWRTVDSADDLREAAGALGLPLVLKTRRLGYDGKGQAIIREERDIEAAWQRLGGRASIAEQCVSFDRELSVIGARGLEGEVAVYPLTENVHEQGILRVSKAPAESAPHARAARKYLEDLLGALDYVGVLALEMFALGDNLLANEFAPRVHNSGHWTIEGSRTSQFENHLRAILGMPLGDTACVGHAGMINLIGTMPRDREALLAAGFYLHDYGKRERPGRKLGHATVVSPTADARDRSLEKGLKILAK
jgi:5-(carboxyamino)imidazole ribonucleotide synthase